MAWHSHFLKRKKYFPLVGTVLKADWLTPLLTIRLNFKPHVKWNAFDARAVIKIANCLHCLLTPRNTSVSSKNISSDPYYCYSRSLAVTSRVKRTCSPAVNWCTPAAPPARINRLLLTGKSQLFNEVNWFRLFPTITESCKPRKIVHFYNLTKELWSGKTV